MDNQAKEKKPTTLWQHANFLRFWGANIISDFGSGITVLALPIIAAVSLEASPSVLFGLPMGGFFGELWGLRTAVAISSAGLLLSVLWVYFSPLSNQQQDSSK